MNNKNKLLVLLAVTGAGCAQTPVPVVNGYKGAVEIERQPQVSVVAPTTAVKQSSIRTVAATPKVEEIEPAAGPAAISKATVKKPAQTASQPIAAPAPKVELVGHQVGPMDTVYSLARQYDTSPKDILNRNGLKTTSDIQVGQTLLIPSHSRPTVSAWDQMKQMLSDNQPATPAPTAPVATKTAAVTTEPVEATAAVTPAVQPKLAEIEPAAGRPPQKDGVVFVDHQVVAGETIYRISRTYNASVLDIMAANAFDQPQDLKAGTVVKVPVNQKVALRNTADDGVTLKNKKVEEVKAAAETPQSTEAQAVKAAVEAQEVKKPEEIAGQGSEDTVANEDVASKDDADATEQTTDTSVSVAKEPETKLSAAAEDLKIELKRGQIDPIAAKASGPVWPVKGTILKGFGAEGNGVAHTGINIAVPAGTPVLAMDEGTVLYADEGLKTYGKLVLLRHPNGMVSAYAHNGHLLVRKGEKVQKGQIIATSGATGNVDTPQLHFELRRHASALDPLSELPKLSKL